MPDDFELPNGEFLNEDDMRLWLDPSPLGSEFGHLLDIVPPSFAVKTEKNVGESNISSLALKEDSLFTKKDDVILIPPVLPKQFIQLQPQSTEVSGDKKREEFQQNTDTSLKKVKSPKFVQTPNISLSEGDQIVERRERNREHAKRSRIRKKLLLDSLQDQLMAMRKENATLRRIISDRIPHLAAKILSECTTPESDLLSSEITVPSSSKISPLTNNIGQTCLNSLRLQQNASQATKQVARVLMEADYRLMQTLVASQQNFVLSDPSLPDNPIVYVSEGFCRMTGYKRQDVIGRNCRFLQGPGTDPAAVDIIRQGVREGRDISVCLLNYKADGKPFWNQFFMAPLKDGAGQVVNFVGVQCEVNTIPVTAIKERVKKLPIPEDI